MTPIAELKYDLHDGGHVTVPRGTIVFVLGYTMQRESPLAIIMHPKRGWHTAELHNLIPKGFRASGGMIP